MLMVALLGRSGGVKDADFEALLDNMDLSLMALGGAGDEKRWIYRLRSCRNMCFEHFRQKPKKLLIVKGKMFSYGFSVFLIHDQM